MHGLVMAAMLTLAVGAHTDTTLAVSTGTTLELENYAGSIEVGTWGRNAVRIEAEPTWWTWSSALGRPETNDMQRPYRAARTRIE